MTVLQNDHGHLCCRVSGLLVCSFLSLILLYDFCNFISELLNLHPVSGIAVSAANLRVHPLNLRYPIHHILLLKHSMKQQMLLDSDIFPDMLLKRNLHRYIE
jgi:hypothetical protein